MTAGLNHIVALVPVRSLSGAKSRLGEPLDAEERADLILALLRRTVEEALAATRLAGVVVVSKDEDLLQPGPRHGRGVAAAGDRRPQRGSDRGAGRRRRRGHGRDGPAGGPARRSARPPSTGWPRPPTRPRSERAREARRRAGAGPPRQRHERPARGACRTRSRSVSARAAGPPTRRPPKPRAPPTWSWTGRSASTSTRPRTCSTPTRAASTTRRAGERRCEPRQARPPDGRLSVIALSGVPEIRAGDDLAAMLDRGNSVHARRAATGRGRRPGGHSEGRLQGRRRHRRPDDGRPSARSGRLRRALGPRPPPARGRPARGPPRRPHGQRSAHHRDEPRLRLRQRRRRRIQHGPRERERGDAAAGRSGRVRGPHSLGRPVGAAESTCR